jgi:hypothetical protein
LALGLLLVNDNLLKGGGWAPGWLTGKLSDFAFLIVAPVLATALLPARWWGRRTIAFAAVVGVYVAADLSADASDLVVRLAGQVGLAWRLWPDVTDLLALVVLPLAWRLAGAPPRPASAGAAWCGRTGVIVGAFACLATSAPLRYPHAPFLLNRLDEPARLRLTWVLKAASCAEPLADLASRLGAGDLDVPREVTVPRGRVVALNEPPDPGKDPVGSCGLPSGHAWQGQARCTVVLLEADGAPALLARAPTLWEESDGAFLFPDTPDSACAPSMDPGKSPGPDAVSLVKTRGGREWRAGKKVEILLVSAGELRGRRAESPACGELRAAYDRLVATRACATDEDCTAAAPVPVPGAGEAICATYVNVQAVAELAQLGTTWRASCFQGGPSHCAAAQPPVCRGGRCEARCPGIVLPECPRSCSDARFPHVRAGDGCQFALEMCQESAVSFCVCTDGKFRCGQPHPAARPECPLACTSDAPQSPRNPSPTPARTVPADGGAAAADALPGDDLRER